MVKIFIKIGILVVLLVVMFLGFNLFIKKGLLEKAAALNAEKDGYLAITSQLDILLKHQDKWENVFQTQRRDIEYFRAVIPQAPFDQDTYLRILIDIFHKSNVFSTGVNIKPAQKPAGAAKYFQFFNLDLGILAGSIGQFDSAFKYLVDTDTVGGQQIIRGQALMLPPEYTDEDLELALWYSYRFNQMMAITLPEGITLLSGFELHRFDTTVKGSYNDIKRYVWYIQNMKPHTVIANWHLSPGPGTGESRLYSASMTLVTFVDTNGGPVFGESPYPDLPDMPDIKELTAALNLGG